MYMFSPGNGAQCGLIIIECDLIFYAMVLYEKYTLLMSLSNLISNNSSNIATVLKTFKL